MRISDWSSDVCSSDLISNPLPSYFSLPRAKWLFTLANGRLSARFVPAPSLMLRKLLGGAGRQTFCKRNVHDRADFLVGTISDLARNLSFETIRRIFQNDVDRAACGFAPEQGFLRTGKRSQD